MLTPEQIALRKMGVGGSEIAAVMGLDPYKSKLDVWLEKTGQAPPFAGNAATDLGNRLEPIVADLYSEEMGVRLAPCSTVVHPSYPHVLATPDRIAQASPAFYAVELKTRSWRTARGFGPPGSDLVPEPVALQVHYTAAILRALGITTADYSDVGLLVDGREFSTYRLPYDAEIVGVLIEQVTVFWRLVESRTAPEIDGSDSATAYVKGLFAKAGAELMEATAEDYALMIDYDHWREKEKEAVAEKARFANALRLRIGKGAGLDAPLARALWTNDKDGTSVDWEVIARVSGASPDTIKRYTKTVPGKRVLRVTLKESK